MSTVSDEMAMMRKVAPRGSVLHHFSARGAQLDFFLVEGSDGMCPGDGSPLISGHFQSRVR
jgi:hypothetical protein